MSGEKASEGSQEPNSESSKPGPGLQRSASKANMLFGNQSSSANSGSIGGHTLRRSQSRPNLWGSSANLKDLADQGPAKPEEKSSLSLRRTGSKVSLADLPKTFDSSRKDSEPEEEIKTEVNSKVHVPVKSQAGPSSIHGYDFAEQTSAIADPPELELPESVISAGLPRLQRSRSMNHFEALKAPVVSEAQKAVESISGKVDLSFSKNRSHGSHSPEEPRPRHGDASADADSSIGYSGPLPTDKEESSQHSFDQSSETTSDDTWSSSSSPSTQWPSALVPSHSPQVGGPSPRDDYDLRPEAGKRVDYFSHNWNESDIAGSWRYIINRRQDMANSARLENASWRMWAKAKNNLRTVDPSTVNWLKDYDVTWLYGPLYHELDHNSKQNELKTLGGSAQNSNRSSPRHSHEPSPSASPRCSPRGSPHGSTHSMSKLAGASHSRPGKMPIGHLKSILKKKSMAQLMLEEVHELELTSHPQHQSSSHARSTANYMRHHQYRPVPHGHSRQVVADILNRQYRSANNAKHARRGSESPCIPDESKTAKPTASPQYSPKLSSSSTPSSPSLSYQGSSIPASIYSHQLRSGSRHSNSSSVSSSRRSSQISFHNRPQSLRSFRSGSYNSYEERRVHFNDRVEQCIALDPENQDEEEHGSAKERPNFKGSGKLSNEALEDFEDDSDEEDEEDDEDDNGGGLFLGLRRHSMLDVKQDSEKPHIIAALPATTLKHEEDEFNDEEAENEELEEASAESFALNQFQASSSRRPGFNAQYAPYPVQTFEIVDPEIRPVKFEAKGLESESSDA